MRKLRHPAFAVAHARTGAISPFEIWNGTEGDDVHVGTTRADTLNGKGGDDTLSGGLGNDLLDGGEGDDILAGDAGDNTVRGGAGDDRITSIDGADTIEGGEGDDFWIGSYATAADAITFDQRTGVLSNGTTLAGIELISLTTGSGDDRFTTNGDQAFTISAGDGSDTFVFDPTGRTLSATPLAVSITVQTSGALNTTVQGDGFGSAAYGMEDVTVMGGAADDRFTLTANISNASALLSLDGGDGTDTFVGNLAGRPSIVLIDQGDGTSETNIGTIANFEAYELQLGQGTNTIGLGGGDDKVSSAVGGRDSIDGGGGDDTITTNSRAIMLEGGGGADTITAYQGADTILGGGGDDVIGANGANMTIDGGGGNDRWSTILDTLITFDQAAGTLSNGTKVVNVESIAITTARGGRGSTLLITQASDLTVMSQNYRDTFVIDLSSEDKGVTFDASTEDRIGHLIFGDTDITTGPIRAETPAIAFTATAFDDVVTLADLEINDVLPALDGGAGFDTLGLRLAASSQFVVAEDGTITSTFGDYESFERFDILVGGGTNIVSLGEGDDTITVIESSIGGNALSGGSGEDVIVASQGADKLDGGVGDDELHGGDGDDTLNGSFGADLIDGGAGRDAAGYDGAAEGVKVSLLIAGAQNTQGAGFDTLVGIENLYGSEFKDRLTGDANANTLRGREDDDLLKGGAGDDRLEGGPGADRMAGGKGGDTFAFMKLTDISLGRADHVTDFRHTDGDRIEFSNIDLSKDAGDQAFTFIGTSAFTGADDLFELRVQDTGNGNWLVQGDIDHDGAADFTIAVKTDAPLVASDFVL